MWNSDNHLWKLKPDDKIGIQICQAEQMKCQELMETKPSRNKQILDLNSNKHSMTVNDCLSNNKLPELTSSVLCFYLPPVGVKTINADLMFLCVTVNLNWNSSFNLSPLIYYGLTVSWNAARNVWLCLWLSFILQYDVDPPQTAALSPEEGEKLSHTPSWLRPPQRPVAQQVVDSWAPRPF